MTRFTYSAALILLTAACSSAPSDQPDLVSVTGAVTLDAAPVEGAKISFQPVDGRRGAAGITDADGVYELYYVRTPGCPIGECTVTISTFGDVLDEFGGVAGVNPERIPKSYRGQNSTLTANVTAGEPNTIDFDLATSAGDTSFD